MKGIIFNLVEDAIVHAHGEETWDKLLERSGVEGAYTSLGNYPDSQLTALIEAGADMLGVPPDDLTRALGEQATLGLAQQYPHFFTPHENAKSFVLTLNDIIHAEVRKIHTDAVPPDFTFDEDGSVLLIHYFSRRGLCALAEGMLQGAATHFGDELTLEQTGCTHRGAPHCTIRATFGTAPHSPEQPAPA